MLLLRRLRSTTFRSLEVRNYRIFFVGQLVSVCGTWMQTIALAWLVLHLSHDSGLAVGSVVAVQFLPQLVLGVWGGVLADRFDKRRLLVAAQSAMALTAGGLAAVTLGGVVELWMVYALTLLGGFAQLVDVPTRQAFVSEMVGDEHLHNAIGLNSTLFQLARVVGPAFAGVVVEVVGTGVCFLINSVSFVAVIVALVAMRPDELIRGAPVPRSPGQIREGLRYIWRTPTLRWCLLLMALVGTLSINFPVVLPLLAKVTFHGTAATYSLMTIAMGAGALVGALAVASRARPGLRRFTSAGVGFGIAICLAAVAPSLGLLVAALVVVGYLQVGFLSGGNTLVQTTADPRMRGRVMAVWAMTILGTTPIGGPFVGWLCGVLGARWGLAVGGVAALVGASTLVVVARRAGAGGGRFAVATLATGDSAA